MRKLIVALGFVLVAASLTTLMVLDREVNLIIFGITTTTQPSTIGSGFIRQPQTQTFQLLQTTTYIKLASYLIGVSGLLLILLGILLEPKKGGGKTTEVKEPCSKEAESNISKATLINLTLPYIPQPLARPESERDVIIRLSSVTKTYSGNGVETPALRGVSLEIFKGEFVAIVGPSGSGKSTLLNMMGCLDTPSKGRIYIDGVDTSKLSSKDLAELRNKKIGFIFQSFNLIQRMTALANVEYPLAAAGVPPKIRRQKALQCLQIVGLSDKSNRPPSKLSGGEQQRVAIARALVTDAPLLLCDEPTGNLDTQNTQSIINLLHRLNKEFGKTLVVITHNMDLAKTADRILFIRDGLIEKEERLRGLTI
ncbi:MAG: ABC transporter ATP-binding protein [Nitrososphaerales archaeon]